MKYGGTVLIVDDEGNPVFERELTADEMIDELLKDKHIEIVNVPIEEEAVLVTVEPEPTPVPAPVKKGTKVCKKCGKPGHMQKTCPDNYNRTFDSTKGTPVVSEPTPREVLNFSPLSKVNFDVVKEMQEEGKDLHAIASEVEHDIDDVEVAMKSSSYLGYTFDRKKLIAQKLQHKK
jgi:hypothetical protein